MKIWGRQRSGGNHSARDYQGMVRRHLKRNRHDRTLALAQIIGAPTMEDFARQGDGHVAVLRHHGLADGMAVYDLGCGCGRTAQALQRSGWSGDYTGADVVPELLDELRARCPDYRAVLEYAPRIAAQDNSLDLVFHWSVVTHLYPTESFAYMRDAFRALKPGGRMVFSFLELEAPHQRRVWEANVARLGAGERPQQLDAFLHRDWIRFFASEAGYTEPSFTNGDDEREHPPFWQSLAVMDKPLG